MDILRLILRFRAVWAAAILGLAALNGATPASADARLVSVEAEARGDGVALELGLSASAPVTFFTLDAPRRLVVDVATGDGRGPDTIPPMPDGLGAPRFGLFTDRRARMVLPLARPFRVSDLREERSAGGATLHFALEPVSKQAYAARAGWPAGARWDGADMPLPPERPGDGRLVVMIDPGHGGNDPGALMEGLSEKDLVLAFARRLAERLNGSGRIVAQLTRDRDVFLPLGARVRLAQRARAQLFISIHADIVTEGEASGLSVYTLAPEATDDATEALAERENRSDVLSGAAVEGMPDDVAMVLIDLAQRGTLDESQKLAEATLDALAPSVDLLHGRPHRKGNFRVLKAPEIPSLLIELGFLTSAADRQRIQDPDWQERAAVAIEQGILGWTERASAGYVRPKG